MKIHVFNQQHNMCRNVDSRMCGVHYHTHCWDSVRLLVAFCAFSFRKHLVSLLRIPHSKQKTSRGNSDCRLCSTLSYTHTMCWCHTSSCDFSRRERPQSGDRFVRIKIKHNNKINRFSDSADPIIIDSFHFRTS